MNYMPEFMQSATQYCHEHQLNQEADLLKEQSQQNLSRLLMKLDLAAPESVYKTRLVSELQILADKGFCGYFLIVADYVHWAKDNGIAVGPGRGSGPCSLVGFAMGITNIDPIKYGLPFERFINPDRDSLPDFDLEFCAARRDEVSNYLQSRYGTDRVAQISSGDNTPLPSRLVICNRSLTNLVPLYSNPLSGFPATKMTMAQIKSAGLVQFNVINQKALTVIQRTVRELEKSGSALDINNIALDDAGAYRLLSSGETSNIAVLDDEHYKTALMAVRPDRFENLCAVVALSQPHILQDYIPLFVERSQNSELIQYFHPAFESITVQTYGLILYQEQLMYIAQKIAGFSLAHGDLFRRALKHPNREAVFIYKKQFIEGAIDFGLSQTEATGLFEHLAISERHKFNKSHAVAFALIAYQTAWLKANYSYEYSRARSTV